MLALQAPSLPAQIPRTQSFGAPPIPPPFSQIEDIPPQPPSLQVSKGGVGGAEGGGGSTHPTHSWPPTPHKCLTRGQESLSFGRIH